MPYQLHVTTSGGNDAFGSIATAVQDVWTGYDIYFVSGFDGVNFSTSGNFDHIGDTSTFGGSGVGLQWDGNPGLTATWLPWYAPAGMGTAVEGVWYHVDHRYSPGTPNVTEEVWIDGVNLGEVPSGANTDPVVQAVFGVFTSDASWPLDFYMKNLTVGTSKGATDIWDGDLSSGDVNVAFDSVSVSAPATLEIESSYPAPGADVIVTLDGFDITNCCVAGNWTRRLNRPSTAQIRVPMDCASAAVGSLLKIEALVGTTYQIVHHGRVLLIETDTGEDFGYTTYNSTDPMELWQWRPVRDDTCDFSDPTIIDDYNTGPQIIEAALTNTVYCGDGSQADTEGPIFLDMGTFAGGGVTLSGAPTDWPMTIAELASLLVSTGELDLVITPTDPGGGVMGTIDGYNGDYGTDLSATVVFSYGMGAYNVRRLRWNEDMTTMVNKLWYYGGPKVATAADPAATQHWCFNVTGDDGSLAYPPGGALSPPASATNNQLGVLRASSESAYGVRMDIQIFDAYDDCQGVGTVGRDLFRYRWQTESWLRAQPREIIHVTPIRGTEIGTFDIGDLVTVEATAAVRGGFSGVQRVYEYTVSWDQDGVLELSEIQTSADNEGL